MFFHKFFIPLLALTIGFNFSINAQPFKTPLFIEGEELYYKVTFSKNTPSPFNVPRPLEIIHKIERATDEKGRKIIRHFSSECRNDKTIVEWVFSYTDTQPTLRCLNFTRRIRSPSGEEFFYEYAELEDPFLNFPENIAHAGSIPFLMSVLRAQEEKSANAYVWAQDGKPTHIFVCYAGEEEIRVAAGLFKAWRVVTKVDKKEVIEPWGIFGNLIAKLIPEFVFWYDQKPPYRVLKIKVDFGSSGTGAPIMFQELHLIKR